MTYDLVHVQHHDSQHKIFLRLATCDCGARAWVRAAAAQTDDSMILQMADERYKTGPGPQKIGTSPWSGFRMAVSEMPPASLNIIHVPYILKSLYLAMENQ
jgi:hypothetical protein